MCDKFYGFRKKKKTKTKTKKKNSNYTLPLDSNERIWSHY